jgi:hypothetical protein
VSWVLSTLIAAIVTAKRFAVVLSLAILLFWECDVQKFKVESNKVAKMDVELLGCDFLEG